MRALAIALLVALLAGCAPAGGAAVPHATPTGCPLTPNGLLCLPTPGVTYPPY